MKGSVYSVTRITKKGANEGKSLFCYALHEKRERMKGKICSVKMKKSLPGLYCTSLWNKIAALRYPLQPPEQMALWVRCPILHGRRFSRSEAAWTRVLVKLMKMMKSTVLMRILFGSPAP